MGALHAPLDALFKIAARRPLQAGAIASIDVYMAHAAYHHGWWELERPITPIAAQMNVGYVLAVATLDGAAMVRQFSPARIERDDVWALIPRIKAHHEAAFDQGEGRGATRLVISFADGGVEEELVRVARSIGSPLPSAEVEAKFRTLTDAIVAPERQRAIVRAVADLETLPDVRILSALIAPVVGSAFEVSD
ncbi:MAG: hypothetical protein WDM85_12725 [Caulobacteraceae bacterium]